GGTTWSDLPGATSATLSFTTSAGLNQHQYRAQFTNSTGTVSGTAATLTVETVTNPASETVIAGQAASFTVSVAHGPAPAIQWQLSSDGGATFADIPGATSATYSFTAAANLNQHQYRAAFTDAAGTVKTTAATLTVLTVTDPANATVFAGQ